VGGGGGGQFEIGRVGDIMICFIHAFKDFSFLAFIAFSL